jgi:CheY-like chemotaxis protein
LNKRILIVDDEKNIRTTLADILQDEGYQVSTAGTGERAVKMCQRTPYDVVLMDVRMPGIDGVEAFRRIRRERDDVRVIMMSAYSVGEVQREAMEEGVSGFVRKPLDIEGMLELIDRATTGRD